MWVLAFLLFVDRGLSADALECSYNEIACAKDETCIVQDYICDDSYDCNDESDEDKELCGVWRNDRCPVKSALCIRNGNESCVEISEYCSTANPPCEGNVDRRICSMLRRGRLLDLNSFRAGWNWNMSEQLGEAFREVIPFTISHEKCPLMYTLVGESCVSIFLIGNDWRGVSGSGVHSKMPARVGRGLMALLWSWERHFGLQRTVLTVVQWKRRKFAAATARDQRSPPRATAPASLSSTSSTSQTKTVWIGGALSASPAQNLRQDAAISRIRVRPHQMREVWRLEGRGSRGSLNHWVSYAGGHTRLAGRLDPLQLPPSDHRCNMF
ncbi:uncharacterized protein LOC135207919 isoform X1 [Macrobrachium nipponense]|uniref:uncharacterized protein LOC135207919 isoform X1 n=1 Tax=Macrobrachium nipponense TaxID=159736 RepID=UPI0030C88C67